MIYSSEADIVPFVKCLVQSLQPYAKANEVSIRFSSCTTKQVIQYQPALFSQSLVLLICNIINLVPPKSKIKVRLLFNNTEQNLRVEVENNGINLIRVNDVCTKCVYSFKGYSLPQGTLYLLVLPSGQQDSASHNLIHPATSDNSLPQFYKEIQKRFRTYFTKTEKLIATLEQNQPQQAAFMQKINALIKVNLEDENFDTNALCSAMSMSRTQLFRRLKTLIMQAPAQHIKMMRLQKAKELLETTDMTVSEVAFKTGFQTVSHFTAIFRRQYSIVPSVFRRRNKPATNE